MLTYPANNLKRALIGKLVGRQHADHASYVQFVKQFLERGNKVLAGVRTPDKAQALHDLRSQHDDKLSVLQLDVKDMDSIQKWGRNVAAQCDHADVRTLSIANSVAACARACAPPHCLEQRSPASFVHRLMF